MKAVPPDPSDLSPKSPPFLKLGKIEIRRPDSLNWVITGDEGVRYYPTLASAIKRAAVVAADAKAKDAQEWLHHYDRSIARLERLCKEVQLNQQDPSYLRYGGVSQTKETLSEFINESINRRMPVRPKKGIRG